MSSEPFDQPDSGYPEEGPPGAAPDDAPGDASGDDESAVREKSATGEPPAGSEDDKATGNPRTTGGPRRGPPSSPDGPPCAGRSASQPRARSASTAMSSRGGVVSGPSAPATSSSASSWADPAGIAPSSACRSSGASMRSGARASVIPSV